MKRLTLEQIRKGHPDLTRDEITVASVRLLAALRRNRDTLEKGLTPGTTRAQTPAQRAEARAFWKGDK